MATNLDIGMIASNWTARTRAIALALLAAAWVTAIWTDRAEGQSVVNGKMTTTVDTPLSYEANGTVNTSNAWSDNNPPAVSGPWYATPAKVPAPADGLGAYWEFSVRHTADLFSKDQATNARLWVKGRHIRVPEPGHNEGPNALPEIGTEKINIPAGGKRANVATWGGVPHESHTDVYGVVGKKMAYTKIGATATLGGEVEVKARHSEGVPKEFENWKTKSSLVSLGYPGRPDGSTVSFDAATGTLSFAPGRIDVLDLQGGLSRQIDPRYANDPILNARLSVSDIRLKSRQADGRFVFSGGSVRVDSQHGELGLLASFDEYVVGDTSRQLALDSFGVLSRGETTEMPETEMPTFLSDFVDDHLLGKLPTSQQFSEHVLNFAFSTLPGMDLATITNGFTRSVQFLPADIYIGGGGYDLPELPTPGDYNGDNLVDSRDYVVWHSEFGRPNSAADGNGNGVADAADYTTWRDHEGAGHLLADSGHLAANAIAVPEATASALALITLCMSLPASRIRAASKPQAQA